MANKAVFSIFRKGLLEGRSAIVTGGGTGIGKAITEELLFLGCKVMIASRKIDRLAAATKEIHAQLPPERSSHLQYTECNIRKEDQVQNLVSTAIEKFGKIDFLINNGGGQFPSNAEAISLKGWNAVIETNLTGTFLMCREAYNQWMKDHGGSIVNIVADMFKGMPLMIHSGAARAGVDNITKSLSVEWASSGVRVNAVAPGVTFSETAAANYGDSSLLFGQSERIPAKRLAVPEEMSAAVVFLLSPAAAFISGETLRVDGAHSLYSGACGYVVPDHSKLPAYKWKEDAKRASEETTEETSNKSKL